MGKNIKDATARNDIANIKTELGTVGLTTTSQTIKGGINEVNSRINNINTNAYDDTQIKQDINNIKTEIGTEELTTTDQTIKGAVNEIDSQIKDITYVIGNDTNVARKINGAISDGYKRIKLPSGTFEIDEPIILQNFVEIFGNKDTILTTNLDIPILTTNQIDGINVSEVYIHDITFKNTHSHPTNYQLDLCNLNMSKIERVKITTQSTNRNSVGGIKSWQKGSFSSPGGVFSININTCDLRNSSVFLGITDSYISNTNIWGVNRQFALHISASSQQINNCQFVGGEKGAILVKNESGYDVEIIKINNCYFDGSWDNIQSGIGLNAYKMRCSNISNNSFWHQKQEGIVLANCFGNTITNNNFNCNGKNNKTENNYNVESGIFDINIKGETRGNIISNNTFYATNDYFIKPRAINTAEITKCDGNVIMNNSIFTNGAYNENSFNFIDSLLVSNVNTVISNYRYGENKDSYINSNLIVNGELRANTGFKTSLLFSIDSVTSNMNTFLKPNGQIKNNYLVCNNGCIRELGFNVETGIETGEITLNVMRYDEIIINETIDVNNKYFKIITFKHNEKRIYKGDLLKIKIVTSSDLNNCDQATLTLNITQ